MIGQPYPPSSSCRRDKKCAVCTKILTIDVEDFLKITVDCEMYEESLFLTSMYSTPYRFYNHESQLSGFKCYNNYIELQNPTLIIRDTTQVHIVTCISDYRRGLD
jgi:hypothetical protein